MKTMMYNEPEILHGLLSKLTDMYGRFTLAQIDAGADVIMLFDLNAPAALSPHDYREFAFPYLKELVDSIKAREVPIVFASDGTTFLSSPVAGIGIDVIGLDWTIGMSDAIKRLGRKHVVQDNLEHYCLFASEHVIEKRVREIVDAGKKAPAHIFSLGGWVLMDTPFEKVKFLVDLVHSL
jgi:uroporphyrinogen decarboxylase